MNTRLSAIVPAQHCAQGATATAQTASGTVPMPSGGLEAFIVCLLGQIAGNATAPEGGLQKLQH